MSVVSLKTGAVSAAAAALLGAGLLFGGALVGAQTPEPTPSAPQEQTAPKERAPHECDKDGDGRPDGAGSSGSGVRSQRGMSSSVRF